MSDTLLVNFVALQEASGHIGTAIATLNDQLDRLEQDAAPLVSTWDGAAKEAYAQRQKAWRSAATDLATMLTEIKRALDESAVDYQNTEQRNTRLFGG